MTRGMIWYDDRSGVPAGWVLRHGEDLVDVPLEATGYGGVALALEEAALYLCVKASEIEVAEPR